MKHAKVENNDNVIKKYDVVVIGSGIGGLVLALVLAKNDYKVCVLEKNHQIGGALQVFSRDKRVFDTGVHYIGGLDKGENLYKIFHYLEIYDDLHLERMDEAFDIIRLPNGKQFRQGQGYDKFIQFLEEDFPHEKEAIRIFVEKIKETCQLFPLYNLSLEGEKTYYSHSEIMSINAWEFVSALTNNKDLIATLLGNGILYAGDKKRTPWHMVALIMNSYINGSYRLGKGGANLSKALQKQIRKFHGDIFKRKEVVGMKLSDNKHIEAVQCSDKTFYYANAFVSNLHPHKTMEIMGQQHFKPATIKRIASLNNTISSFMVNISLKENAFPYLNHNHYDFFTNDVWDTVDYDADNWPQVIFSCTAKTSPSSQYAQVLSAMTYLKQEEFAQWNDTFNTMVHPNKRGSEYEAKKQQLQDKVLARLYERYPRLKDAVREIYSSSPLTFRDYLGTVEGEIYGIEKDYNNSMITFINSKTKIPNLYLTGQNIVFHGILGTTIGALVSSFNFVDPQRLVNEINAVQ